MCALAHGKMMEILVMHVETTPQPSDRPNEHLTPLDPYGYQVNSSAQEPASATPFLRIGLVCYHPNNAGSASTHVTLECVICEQAFALQPVCGVAADRAYAFVGNVCFDCLAISVARMRQLLQQTSARLCERAAQYGDDDEEQVIAKRLLIEAANREQWATGELQHPGDVLLAAMHKRDILWKKYGLLKELTTITYQAWFDQPPEDATQP